MPTEAELIQERIRKMQEFRKLGINPYPYRYSPTHTARQILDKYKEIQIEESKDKVCVAGRIVSIRRMGKLTFCHIRDHTDKIQLFIREDALGKDYELLKLWDIGDWVGAEGAVFKTKTGEVSVLVSKAEMLCKAIRPFPEKWHGLKDIEIRYRKRYLDLVMNPEVREVFRKRTKIIDAIRSVLNNKGFIEVETPVLQPIYGGAAAKPFKTHLNTLNQDVFLRIAPELYLKKLIVGGMDRVYEIGKNYRNEDIDRSHNPEFTSIEIYQAYADFKDMMELTEDLYVAAAMAVHGSTKFEYQGHTIDVKKPWKVMTMIQAINELGNVDVEALDDKSLLAKVPRKDLLPPKPSRGIIIQALFEQLCEEKLIQPTFITHHPIETTPLCKPCRDGHKGMVERFEPFIAGMEIANAYSELNDPILQRKLLEEQAKSGSEWGNVVDEDFIQSIEYGMPPTGGVGIGIDRMVMIITNSPSIRDVLFFPFMKV
ncbi:MAG: lysine--tRNA ligase [Candidatus Woesearchaeota archaeon]